MLPDDLEFAHLLAASLIFVFWFAYSALLTLLGRGTLNSQLMVVRSHWMRRLVTRSGLPYDAVLLGHVVHSMAFFGSATLLVVAGWFAALGNIENIHATATRLHFVTTTSLELFSLKFVLVGLVLLICFLSFIYALRKFIYAMALIGALPKEGDHADKLVEYVSIVITQALTTFNFGFRGFYYVVAAFLLFVSPLACVLASLLVTVLLVWRQMGTKTARAIESYADLIDSTDQSPSD